MSPANFARLYWFTRLGIALIWLWTAFVSWYVYPHGDSIDLLRRTGIVAHGEQVLAASCLLDLLMGLATLFYARSCIFWAQFALVAGYSLIIMWKLPEFLMHPFGEISKNLSVLACLAFLALAPKR